MNDNGEPNDAAMSLLEAFAKVMQTDRPERDAVITEVCGTDLAMRDQLIRLIVAADSASDANDPLSDSAVEARRRDLESGERAVPSVIEQGTLIANYEIQSLLGEGGMGAVYLATQQRPSRQVALKLLRTGFPSERQLRRFELEAETLGKLRHPGIAQIYEAGVHDGRPYFAMEYVDGLHVTEYAKQRKLGTRERLKLIARIASAVQHAHQHGVIHRDLKPANILVTESDSKEQTDAIAQPKILDFGVAKLTASDVNVTTLRTDIGQLVGTISYMSPEQASGDPESIDTRSDVYALGVIAYELLTGKLPLDVSDRLIHEAIRIVREDEPTRLSATDHSLRGDVETIVGKALEKDVQRRYESPAEFASDIERYLSDQPIQARPASTWYQLKKFSRRNRSIVAAVAAGFAILVAGLIATTTFAVRAEKARVSLVEANAKTEEALSAETQRSQELEAVASYQEQQLSSIDAMTVGLNIREGLVNRLQAPGAPTPQSGAADVLRGIDYTGLALEVLQQSFFDQSLKALESQFKDQPLVLARLLQSLAKSAERVGLIEFALDVQRDACTTYAESAGEEHPDTLHAMNNLGMLLTTAGDFEEAETVLTRTLQLHRQIFGSKHLETLSTIDNMGLLMNELGRNEESARYMRESLEGHREVSDESDPALYAAINSMASVYESKGDYAGAEPYMREAYEGNKRILGPDDARTLSSASNVGVNLKRQGKLDEAEPFYIEALEGRRRTLGENHPRTVRSVNNMASLYAAMDRQAEAVEMYRACLEQYHELLGENHPETLICMSNLGASLRGCEEYEESDQIIAAAVEGSRSALPPGHWMVGAFLSQRAQTLNALNRLEAAVECADEAHQIMLSALGEQHPNTVWVSGYLDELRAKLETQ